MQLPRRARALTALAVLAPLSLAACGSKDHTPLASGLPTTSTTSSTVATVSASTDVAVTGVDYAFQGLPAAVKAGTTFTFTNGSDKESHEMVLFKLPADEKRSLSELLALPPDEVNKVTGAPVGVAVAAAPGSDGVVVEGKLEAADPGRYIALCGLPTGGDPKVIEEAATSGKPPAEDPNAGPPHFTKGMVQEFTVE
jgi:plastocyanin